MFRVDGSSFSSELLTLHSEISVEIDGTANTTFTLAREAIPYCFYRGYRWLILLLLCLFLAHLGTLHIPTSPIWGRCTFPLHVSTSRRRILQRKHPSRLSLLAPDCPSPPTHQSLLGKVASEVGLCPHHCPHHGEWYHPTGKNCWPYCS